MNLKIADLFCGPGGLSQAFYEMGHKILFAIDKDSYSIETFKQNHPDSDSKIICGNIEDIFEENDKNILTKNKYDLVMGGPPCQGFSTANRQNIKDDPRNKLYKYFLKFVYFTQPNFVLIENVVGIKKYCEYYSRWPLDLGYSSDFQTIQEATIVFPKTEEEYFFGKNQKLLLNTVNGFFNKLNELGRENKVFTLGDALYGLRPLRTHPKKNDTKNEIEISGFNIEDTTNYQSNDYINLINSNLKPKKIFNHRARYNNERDIKIFGTLPQGADSTHESIQDIMPYKRRENIFKDKYFKLSNDKICKTITSHMKNDCNMYIHPTQPRGLTPCEAARYKASPIISFPNAYKMFYANWKCCFTPFRKKYLSVDWTYFNLIKIFDLFAGIGGSVLQLKIFQKIVSNPNL